MFKSLVVEFYCSRQAVILHQISSRNLLSPKERGRMGKNKQSEAGASLVEYTIAVSAVLLTCIVVMATLGTTLQNKYLDFPTTLFG